MKRSTYLYIFLLSISGFFGITPLGYLMEVGRGFPILVFQLLWLLYGMHKYHKSRNVPKLAYKKNKMIVFWLFLGILPSVFMADYLFDQSYVQSFISYRNLLLFLSIPALLKIRPTSQDIIKAIMWYAVTFLAVTLIRTYITSDLFVLSEKEEMLERKIDAGLSNDFLSYPLNSSYELFIIPLYYYCVKLWKKSSLKTYCLVIFLFGMLLAIQNRSTLFPATCVLLLTVIISRFKNFFLKVIIVAIVLYTLYDVGWPVIKDLIDQTGHELSVSYDPRTKAMNYFLDFKRLTWPEILFGTGNISFQTSNYVELLQTRHIHYSDVGFVGFWSQYGLIPIIVFVYYIIRGIISKYSPMYVRLVGIHILACGATISYYDFPEHMILFILFYYLCCYYRAFAKQKKRLQNVKISNRDSGLQAGLPEGYVAISGQPVG